MSHPTSEPRGVRLLLIAVALGFLALFLVAPLMVVFQQALEKGLSAYLGAIREEDALSALRLTLLTAANRLSTAKRWISATSPSSRVSMSPPRLRA